MRSKSWEDAFCALLGVTQAARQDEFWYADTDVPEEAAAIVKVGKHAHSQSGIAQNAYIADAWAG